ncbi:fibronectin type III domain-containing protein 11 [Pogoniulus pusillus]|uniref:fibronectin type III domain-containing protein 11 n=1 Tax=Pogoniulus pusillus TaxID=488313 RepID=UPI0030B92B58
MQEEPGGSSMSAERGQEDAEDASCQLHQERRSFVLYFLDSTLNLSELQSHQRRVEQLKKCYFYLEVEPKYVVVTEQQHFIDIFELIDPWQFQRMKAVGKDQVRIQLALLGELLEQLERGQEELRAHTESREPGPFLAQWPRLQRRLRRLSRYAQQLRALRQPGRVAPRHRLLAPLEAQRRRIALPALRLALATKPPLLFRRDKSFADATWVRLKWCSEDQECYPEEHYEVYVRLLAGGSERSFSRFQLASGDSCKVEGLEPGRLYEFTVLRPATQTLVFRNWQDTITLRTKP